MRQIKARLANGSPLDRSGRDERVSDPWDAANLIRAHVASLAKARA
jgi:hypothetical protein